MSNVNFHDQTIQEQPLKWTVVKNNWREYGESVKNGIENGAKFKSLSYTVSIIFMTFTVPVVYYIPVNGRMQGLSTFPNLITALFGWWGFPWGPIYSFRSFAGNRGGGKDVTIEYAKMLNIKTKGQIGKEKFKEKLKATAKKAG